jgi:hypothetical protein
MPRICPVAISLRNPLVSVPLIQPTLSNCLHTHLYLAELSPVLSATDPISPARPRRDGDMQLLVEDDLLSECIHHMRVYLFYCLGVDFR